MLISRRFMGAISVSGHIVGTPISEYKDHIRTKCPSVVTDPCPLCGDAIVRAYLPHHIQWHEAHSSRRNEPVPRRDSSTAKPKAAPTHSSSRNELVPRAAKPVAQRTSPRNGYSKKSGRLHEICRHCGAIAIPGNDVCYGCGYE